MSTEPQTVHSSAQSSGSGNTELAALAEQLKALATHLYELETTAADYPANAESLIGDEINGLVNDYRLVEAKSAACSLSVPQDVLEYIEAGRNPSVYTRQFSEAVTRESQNMHGKMTAHREFGLVLGDIIKAEYPNLSKDVDRACTENVPAS